MAGLDTIFEYSSIVAANEESQSYYITPTAIHEQFVSIVLHIFKEGISAP